MSPGPSPFNKSLHPALIPYGPPVPDGSIVEIAESFGDAGGGFEAEYAAIRQRVGVMHLPQRAILNLTGADVKDYLHRLCTQQINELQGGQSVRAFQLDEKGHIAADMVVHHGDDSTWLEMDVFDTVWVKELLEQRLFTEDVAVEDRAGEHAVFWLLGPAAIRLWSEVVSDADRGRVPEASGKPGTHHVFDVPLSSENKSALCTAYRWDLGGVLGIRVVVPSEHAASLHARLLEEAGYDAAEPVDADFAERRRETLRGRPVGWSAFNTVRIEEGVPMYHIDFGRDSLPAEVPGPWGIDGAVSFTKGCYLGQEVVARMKSLGHPKKLLVAWRAEGEGDGLPVAGSQVMEPGEKQKIIGAVTSSTGSPLRGQRAIGMAVVRWGRHKSGTEARVPAGGKMIDIVVHDLANMTQI